MEKRECQYDCFYKCKCNKQYFCDICDKFFYSRDLTIKGIIKNEICYYCSYECFNESLKYYDYRKK